MRERFTPKERNDEYERLLVALRQYRRENGYTQKEFAKILGVSGYALNRWELGISTPTPSNLFKILNVTGLHKILFGYKPKRVRRKKTVE